MPKQINTDVAIIGAGPVGIFAGFQAGMLNMKSCLIDPLEFAGGQCQALYPEKPIYDIPSQPNISGQNLIENLKKQAAPFKPEYLLGNKVEALEIRQEAEKRLFHLTTDKGITVKAKTVLIAAGAGCFGPNRPPLDGIGDFEENSVFYNVTNRQQFANKNIVIAGGGDSAVDWAIDLSKIANKIYVVHRRNKFRASPSSVEKMHNIASQGKIELVTSYQLSGLKGANGLLESVEVAELSGGKRTLAADTLLAFFGLSQDLGPLLKFGLNIHNHHIQAQPPYFETNIEGIYAVGDIVNYPGKLKLILTGFAEVSQSLHHAYPRVFDGKLLHFEYSTSKGVNPK